MGQAAVFCQHGFQGRSLAALHLLFQLADPLLHLDDGALDLQDLLIDGAVAL